MNSPRDEPKSFAEWRGDSPYQRWQRKEGIPVYTGYYIEDVMTLPLRDWDRKGGKGAYLNLGGQQETDGYVAEIPPGESLKVQRHLFEEIVYVLKGRGATSVWQETGREQTFEWEEGSLFAIPLNAWHQHFNGSASEPVRYLASTNLPRSINQFHNENFIFDNPFCFSDRFHGDPRFFQKEGKSWGTRNWETNFIQDVRCFQLDPWNEKGLGARHMRFALADNVLGCHIHEIAVGTYVQAHRHGPGAMVLIVEGSGYELLWMENEPKRRYDFKPGAVVSPGNRMYHQHFNTGPVALRQMALRGASPKWGSGEPHIEGHQMDLISYEREDPEVRTMFEEELKTKGIALQLPPTGRSG